MDETGSMGRAAKIKALLSDINMFIDVIKNDVTKNI